MRRWLVVSLVLVSCKSEPPPPQEGPRVVTLQQPPTASAAGAAGGAGAAASAGPRPPPSMPAPRPWVEQEITFAGRDKVQLSASWYAQDPSAPVLIAVHRLGGQRGEWGPLLKRLSQAGASVLLLDLRGHGRSGPAAGGRVGGGIERADVEAMEGDVLAAVAEVDRRLGRPAAALVGLGSDVGATALVLAARREPRFAALGLVSPVAALRGVDLYVPFASVRSRPTLLMAAKDDPVSGEPARTMSSMVGASVTVKLYEGQAHGAPRLGAEVPGAWDDLWAWLSPTLAASLAPPAAPASASAEPLGSALVVPSAAPGASSAPGAKGAAPGTKAGAKGGPGGKKP